MSVLAAVSMIALCVLQECSSQNTVVAGPTDTVYVNPGVSASFNCTVSWSTSGRPSIYWGRSRDDGATWTNIAQCYDDGFCNYFDGAENEYSVETTNPYNFFKLMVTSPSLSEDGHYDCWSGENPSPAAPHARLYVFSLVTSVTITGYSKGQTKTVTAGDPETFDCTATAGNPPADLIWTIGNNDITNSSEIRDISETGTDTRLYDTTGALLYRFNASDDKQYLKCQSFQHDSLTLVAWQILMDVLHAPVIQAVVVDSWEGNTVVVECLATANPDDVTYSWESGDQTGNTDTSNKWELVDEDGDDEVTMTCNASNNEGVTSLTEMVKKPYIPSVAIPTESLYTVLENMKDADAWKRKALTY
ncbi:cell adhesion molecule 2-like [Ptychodera flava]|uniref:cell adhesion molecule 2-like n=1 Tax=Ptychodera flava TaxID=63121 RepID=UPI00396AB0A4